MTVDLSIAQGTETEPRIAILSLRDVCDHVSSSCGYTFEDVIARDLDEAAIFAPVAKGAPRPAAKAINRLSRRSPFGKDLVSATTLVSLERDYDMFFFYPVLPRDLIYLNSVKDWRKRSGVAICWLQEVWVESLPSQGKLIDMLNEFDHVICSFAQTIDPLRKLLKVPVTYLPWGVDTELFCPYPNPPTRAIDIASVGDVRALNHAGLIDYAERTGKYYSYNTIHGRYGMKSHVVHRRNYANIMKRSKYLLSYIAKVARTVERGNQEEFGLRYIEGIAAGVILLGDRLNDEAFNTQLGWQDSVIDAPYGSASIVDIIEELEADPQRVADIQRRNVIQALNRHDHLYRWEKVLEIAGLAPSIKPASRQARLTKLIALAEQDCEQPNINQVPAA